MELFFVYGTLKSGKGNNHILKDAKLLGNAKTVDEYILYNLGCPAAVRDGKGLPVLGEVYGVEDLKTIDRLDQLEGNGHFYTRHERMVNIGGQQLRCWIYELPDTRWGMSGYCPIDEKEKAYVWV